MLTHGKEKSPQALQCQTDYAGINFKDSIPQQGVALSIEMDATVTRNPIIVDRFIGTVRAFRQYIRGNLEGLDPN